MPEKHFCGSAHCKRKIHVWLEPGTDYARLSAENCGAAPDRTPEELKKADERLRENIHKLINLPDRKSHV